ncbi:Os04g0516550 [Oryza sativa Japonica Group]|uniref:Os04g0516550 protein n=1 Tax=Oryza sativa subsp. japonica TaxID=39947 RepID=A0A0P0WCJ5_ORYSJ|nr:hypothetical protein EE612_024413 [Oryza sativa]BAS90087.1 Os04g0516550 [Oryza sativa Japonica Group]
MHGVDRWPTSSYFQVFGNPTSPRSSPKAAAAPRKPSGQAPAAALPLCCPSSYFVLPRPTVNVSRSVATTARQGHPVRVLHLEREGGGAPLPQQVYHKSQGPHR